MGEHKPFGIYEKFIKRPLDIGCALLALLVFWWIYVIIAVLVRINMGSPILFTQERPGKNERIFKILKFRTMTDARNQKGELLPDKVRLTKFGNFLRKTSLDELPEVFNILKGDMSVVGPRPLLVEYLTKYNDRQKHRHDVRPGLTGLAQIMGRNLCTWEEKFNYDLEYVNRITFFSDCSIIIKTVLKAFIKKEGISSESSVTMEKFEGTIVK